jgi:hypothetical protein
MTACAVAALTIYDMVKSVDRSVFVGELALWEKTGGRSGGYRRTTPAVPTDRPPTPAEAFSLDEDDDGLWRDEALD